MKQCRKCSRTLELSSFHRNSKAKDGRTSYCKECAGIVATKWAKANKAKRSATQAGYAARNKDRLREQRKQRLKRDEARVRALQKRYSRRYHLKSRCLTEDGLAQKLVEQGGGCAICQKQITLKSLHIDHCHSTGRTRDLLCGPCNTALGHIEKQGFLKKAMAYLERHRSRV